MHLSLPCALLLAALMVMKAKGRSGPRKPPMQDAGHVTGKFWQPPVLVPDLPEADVVVRCAPQVAGIATWPGFGECGVLQHMQHIAVAARRHMHSDTSNSTARVGEFVLL